MKMKSRMILVLVFLINVPLKAQVIAENPSIYSRVLELFNSGYLPDLSEIDTSKSYQTKTITLKRPNNVSKELFLYCERVGDELVGGKIVCGNLVNPNASSEEHDLASQKSKLLDLYSVLTTNEDGKEFYNSIYHSIKFCVENLTWREVKLESGARVLISKSVREGNWDCLPINYLSYTFLTGNSDSDSSKL